MENQEITIEDLARMIQKGFEETAKKEEVNLRFEEVNHRFEEVNHRFEEVNHRFDKIENRLEIIEKLLIADHQRRIEKLEIDFKELKELLAIK